MEFPRGNWPLDKEVPRYKFDISVIIAKNICLGETFTSVLLVSFHLNGLFFFQGCHRSENGQGKVREFNFESGREYGHFEKKNNSN